MASFLFPAEKARRDRDKKDGGESRERAVYLFIWNIYMTLGLTGWKLLGCSTQGGRGWSHPRTGSQDRGQVGTATPEGELPALRWPVGRVWPGTCAKEWAVCLWQLLLGEMEGQVWDQCRGSSFQLWGMLAICLHVEGNTKTGENSLPFHRAVYERFEACTWESQKIGNKGRYTRIKKCSLLIIVLFYQNPCGCSNMLYKASMHRLWI